MGRPKPLVDWNNLGKYKWNWFWIDKASKLLTCSYFTRREAMTHPADLRRGMVLKKKPALKVRRRSGGGRNG
jgi:hypothetical protein